jgi:hypothetical protein
MRAITEAARRPSAAWRWPHRLGRYISRTLEAVNYAGWIMLELHAPQADTVEYAKRAYDRATGLLSPDARDDRR